MKENLKYILHASPRTGDCPSGGYAEKKDAGKNNRHNLEGLAIGKTYYFSVTSYNSFGKESCFSEEMSKRIGFSWLVWIKNIFSK